MKLDEQDIQELRLKRSILRWIVLIIFILLSIVAACLVGCPTYNVYQQKKQGQAILAHAQSSREVAVAEAKAKMESSALLAQADTIRAHGIARSNEIIGQSLTAAYLHWFWIDNIDKSNNVIYVPTETNLPIMEAGRLFPKQIDTTKK